MRAFMVLCLVPMAVPAWAVQYTVADLGTFSGMNDSVAYGLNDDRTVVGRSNSGAGWPFAWTESTVDVQRLLGTVPLGQFGVGGR